MLVGAQELLTGIKQRSYIAAKLINRLYTSYDMDAIAQFRQRTDISERSKHKIISDNPCRLYGL